MQSVPQLLGDASAVEHEVAAREVEGYELVVRVRRLLQVVAEGEPGPWRKRAACVGQVEVMFPGRGRHTRAAVELCERCEVLPECRAWGDARPDQHGVVAGMSERSRLHGPRAA